MPIVALSSRIAWLVGIALFLTTVFVTPSNTLDPINVSKLWILTIFGFAVLALLMSQPKLLFSKENRLITYVSLLLPISMVITLLTSDAPLTQQLFGTYGRNTGFLNYFCLSVIFLGVAIASNKSFKNYFLYEVIGTLLVNGSYGFIQAIGKDWANWISSYSPVVGTLGNPDFISAFLGFISSFTIGYLFSRESSIRTKVILGISLLVIVFVIFKTQAQQGLIVFALVFAIVFYFELRNYINSKIIQVSYLVLFWITSILSIAGSLQKGPLTELLYRSSVTQRGDYWHAGFKMLWSQPFTGVGLDSYGDWYRFFRSSAAAERFNGSVVSNSAHNVFIDIAATSGLIAIIAYFTIILLALIASWKIFRSNSKLDPFFISVFAAWIGYLAQSTISINNIGLGIWGWVFPGLIIAMSRWQDEEKIEKNIKKSAQKKIDFSGMFMTGGLVAGFAIGFIPFNADASFRHALETGIPEKIYSAASKWPTDSSRMLYAAKIFESNKLNNKAESIVRASLKQNPRSFETWQFLYGLPTTSGNEKAEILIKLKSLDPNNKNVK